MAIDDKSRIGVYGDCNTRMAELGKSSVHRLCVQSDTSFHWNRDEWNYVMIRDEQISDLNDGRTTCTAFVDALKESWFLTLLSAEYPIRSSACSSWSKICQEDVSCEVNLHVGDAETFFIG